MGKSKTHEEYVKEVEIKNPNVEVIGIYINAKTKIDHRCKKHDVIWSAKPENILHGNGCHLCKGDKIRSSKIYTAEHYKSIIAVTNPNIIIIGDYMGTNVSTMHRCTVCNSDIEMYPTNVSKGEGCRVCARRNASDRLRYSDKEYIRKLHDVMPDVDILEPYKGTNIAILHLCHTCGSTFIEKPQNVLHQGHCTVCSGGRIGSAPEYKNSIWASEYRDFFAMYLTEEQMKTTFPKSGKKIDALCPDCHKFKKISPINLLTKGLSCQCGDTISFANKFVYNVLCQIGLKVKPEYSPSWANKKRYDIFLKDYNLIIENHGKQHYEESTMTTRSLEEEQYNDKVKELMAIKNGIVNYVVLDCRESNMAHIKRSILNSQLPVLLGFSEADVDWTKATAYASKSLVKQAAELYILGYAISNIAKELRVTRNTVTNWLKKANDAGFCEYTRQNKYMHREIM